MCLPYMSFENTVITGEIALLFASYSKLSSANSFNLEESKMYRL